MSSSQSEVRADRSETAAISSEPARALFRAQALAFQRGGGVRGDVLHITPALLSVVYWLVLAGVACAVSFLCTAQVTDYAQGPALVLLDGRHDVTATRAGVVDEVVTHIGARVREGDVLLRLSGESEVAELAAVERELSDQLTVLMRNPGDRAARESMMSLRTRRDVAATALERSVLRAKVAGTVSDLRARLGQRVEAGAPLLALQTEPAAVTVTALLPGADRPRLQAGMPLYLHIDGFDRTSLELTIDSVDEQVLGPAEAVRALGSELTGALDVKGPVVLVRARAADPSFRSRGIAYRLHHGMPAQVDVPVEREPLLYAWLPGLREALSDVF
jgi:membrane fusion protein (multidrug efflux system)